MFCTTFVAFLNTSRAANARRAARGPAGCCKITDRLRRGQGRLEDLQILEEVGDKIGIMPGTTICGLADGAGWPVKQAVRKFRKELESYIKSGQKAKALPVLAAH